MNQDHIFFSVTATPEGKLSSIAALRTDSEGTAITASFAEKVCGERSTPLVTAVDTLRRQIIDGKSETYVVVHHFDGARRVLAEACETAGIDLPFSAKRTWIDVAQLAWPAAFSGALDSRTLDAMARYYAVDCPKTRDTAKEVVVLADVYWRLMARSVQAQKIEGVVDGLKQKAQIAIASGLDSIMGRSGLREQPPAPPANGGVR